MESRLQSNEVRIPKTTASQLTGASSMIASIAFANAKPRPSEPGPVVSLNPPDFDLGAPCQYFKSSFARSLSMDTNQTKSLDFGINFGLSRNPIISEDPHSTLVNSCNSDDFDFDPPPPLPRSQPPSLYNAGQHNTGQHNAGQNSAGRHNGMHQNFGQHNHGQRNHNPGNHNPGHHNPNPPMTSGASTRNGWANTALCKQNSSPRRSYDSAEIEVLRLRKECQTLVEENRRLMGYASASVGGNLVVPGNSANIEAVILQTQVDTLQWQLKQVEASREMYRAVMEEVIRFLERCHRNLDSMQNDQIARSKSVHYVCRNDSVCENNPVSPRARSSTNLMDGAATSKSGPTKIVEESVASSPAATYNNFRDFTWRRSPKRSSSQLATSDSDPTKLAQDAFRLLRTAQNLLNTQEPNLTQPKPSIEIPYSTQSSASPPPSLPHKALPQASSKQKSCQIDSESFCITFSRKLNMRESRLSLRSSTDGSVHSTSSSKTETDEENCSPPLKETAVCSTEDESGFSSISSFQEIGLPLHSTMISPICHINRSTSDDSGESTTADMMLMGMESRNSTLKASQKNTALQPNHRRWDSAPAVPPRSNLHRFSALPSEESSTVLWV